MDQKLIQKLFFAGRYQECLQACQQILQRDSENSLLWKYAGKSYLATGQLEKAHQYLAKAHYCDNQDPDIANDIGSIALSNGSNTSASLWYEKALEININYVPAINNLANIKRKRGLNQEAADLFKRATEIDPQNVKSYLGAAASFLALGDLDRAHLFIIQAISLNPNFPGVNEIIGIIFHNQKNVQKAFDSYQKELAINPRSEISLLNLGLLNLEQGK